MTEDKAEMNSLAINETQLLLAEKRTSLSVMRTGIAFLALPSTVMSLLIATSKYYVVIQVLHFLVPLGILNFALIVIGAYLIIHSIIRMRHYDRLIHEIKLNHSIIRKYIA